MPNYTPNDDIDDITLKNHPIIWLDKLFFFNLGDKLNLDMSKYSGFCFGIACMTMQAILLNSLPAFKERLKMINNLTEEEINTLIDKQDENNDEHYTQKEIDILAFYQGVLIYQNHNRTQSHFFVNNNWGEITTAAALVAPVNLQDQYSNWKANQQVDRLDTTNGPISSPLLSTGIFNKDSMVNWLSSLEKAIEHNNATYPLSIFINNHHHALLLSYDPKERKWICSNDFTILETANTDAITDYIFALDEFNLVESPDINETDKKLVLTTNFLVSTPNLNHATDMLSQWYQNPSAINVYYHTFKKMSIEKTEHLNELIYLCISSGDAVTLNQLFGNEIPYDLRSFTEKFDDPFIATARTSCCPSVFIELMNAGVNIQPLIDSHDPADKLALRMLEAHLLRNYLTKVEEINLNDLNNEENDRYFITKSILFSTIRSIITTSQSKIISSKAIEIINMMNDMIISNKTPLNTNLLMNQLNQLTESAKLSLLSSEHLLTRLNQEFITLAVNLDPTSEDDRLISTSLNKLLSTIRSIENYHPALAYRNISSELIQITIDLATLKIMDIESKAKLIILIEQGMGLFQKNTPRDPRVRATTTAPPQKKTPN